MNCQFFCKKKKKIMEVIEWEKIPESEVKAEIEAALESSGETRKIKAEIYDHPQIQEWRQNIEKLIQNIENSENITQLTPDDIYNKIVDEAHSIMPQDVVDQLNKRIVSFLETEFENHI